MPNKPARGFTLIELLVVLAIIATLLSIVAPRYIHQTDRAKEAALRENLSVMRRALDEYYGDTGQYPDKLTVLTEQHYLRAFPLDPVTNRADSWVPVTGTDNDEKTIVDVKSGAMGKALDGTDYSTW
ncbi:prepilin-type N-terminal cleavage/methylation domain-containing protein [Burkholderia cepacia]|uniref:type II secretion system protein n=1 Tax=Burkholderia cepacia TaxID=292 RepID=UPI001294BCC8|nr:prepilin-type N-terminal cleavage/methylation domain-containing protein [Burkholderia cepacia]MDN7859518.1 prepilin-type N-terminal cleavage/methylation domain-containing protein [Burkholderia cepacia]QFS41297.1 prepilin-type N-terminal cleavage/methylation domai [Burkholderia cepacia]